MSPSDAGQLFAEGPGGRSAGRSDRPPPDRVGLILVFYWVADFAAARLRQRADEDRWEQILRGHMPRGRQGHGHVGGRNRLPPQGAQAQPTRRSCLRAWASIFSPSTPGTTQPPHGPASPAT